MFWCQIWFSFYLGCEEMHSKANLENIHRDQVQPLWVVVNWGLEGELAQPLPSLLTWDLLLHTDTFLLPVALSTDTAEATIRVLTLLVLSWTYHRFTLIHIWGRGERGPSVDC